VEDDKIQFDKMEIENMFAATALSPKGPSAAGAKPSLMKPKNMLITLIDMKRANNCGTAPPPPHTPLPRTALSCVGD
jgi:hypothetical protein